MNLVYIGLGSNLQDPYFQIQSALKKLKKIALKSFRVSDIYQSKPLANMEQPDYLNTVATFYTDLEPLTLLDKLQQIENEAGRVRTEHWGARIIDLDLLLYGNHTINNSRLIVPHYGIKDRSFVLLPLMKLDPNLCLPNGELIIDLIKPEFKEQLHLYST